MSFGEHFERIETAPIRCGNPDCAKRWQRVKKGFCSAVHTFAIVVVAALILCLPREARATPILINSVTDLENIDSNLAGNYALGQNIDATGFSFAPIGFTGSTLSPFTGTLNGNGFSIGNLSINFTGPGFGGLFGELSGTVSNLTLNAPSVVSLAPSFSPESWYGGTVAGELLTGGSISRVGVVGGSVTSNVAGGLVGGSDGTISQSFSSAAVNRTTGTSVNPCCAAFFSAGGGLVGQQGKNGTIIQSYATGSITSLDSQPSGGNFGGLLGQGTGTITESFATGLINGLGGGLVGNGGPNSLTAPLNGTGSYWDTQATNKSVASFVAVPGTFSATGLTTAQFQSGALPAGFDPTVWSAKAGQYPQLQWQTGFTATPSPPLFKQFSPPWGSALTLNGTETMQQSGCFVTSTAMVLNTVGHDTDPGKLNDFLKAYMTGGLLNFSAIPQSPTYGETDGSVAPPVRFLSQTLKASPSTSPLPSGVGDLGVRRQIISELQTLIGEQGPVILRVPSRNDGMTGYGATETHAIVAYQVVGDTVMIRDPGWSSSPGTLDGYIDFVNSYLASKGRAGSELKNIDGTGTGHDLSWLLTTHSSATVTYVEALAPFKKTIVQGSAHSPVELVITDPLGRRLGFDPVHGIYYDEIPDSSYFRELQAADTIDGENPPMSEDQPLEFTIGDYIAGQYQFQVFGIGDGPWSIDFGINDPINGFDPLQFQLSGNASPGSFQEFPENISPTSPSAVPEPSTGLLLLGGGLILLVTRCRPSRKRPLSG